MKHKNFNTKNFLSLISIYYRFDALSVIPKLPLLFNFLIKERFTILFLHNFLFLQLFKILYPQNYTGKD